MRDIILIYNPKAGDTYFRFSLDRFIEIFSAKNVEIRVFRSRQPGDMALYLKECDLSLTEAVFVAGGDGTVNEVVNAMMERNSRLPIGVIPAGTDNDFAKLLGFGEDLEENLKSLFAGKVVPVDVARVNDRYFVNACSAGTLSSMVNVSSDMKNLFGRWAYYIKGVSALPKFHKMDLSIQEGETIHEGRFAFMTIVNVRPHPDGVGADISELSNGMFDLLAVKIDGIANIARVIMKIVRKEPIHEKDVLYIEGKHFNIWSNDDTDENYIEVDGERGPAMPLNIQVYQGALQFFVKD